MKDCLHHADLWINSHIIPKSVLLLLPRKAPCANVYEILTQIGNA